jgi:hypothetical protein
MRRGSVHYAWIVAAVTFVILIVTAGVRATPGVLMISLDSAGAVWRFRRPSPSTSRCSV